MTANSSKWPEIKPLSPASDIQDGQSWISLLNNQSVLEIKGSDAVKFLQGQCTADIEKLAINSSVPGAICTVKGRVLSSFTITRIDDALLLKMPSTLVALTADYLKKYAGRFPLLHIKDEHAIGSSGLTDFGPIFKAAYQQGLESYYVEVEEYIKTPMEEVEESFDYLNNAKYVK